MRLTIATRNDGKLAEFRRLLGPQVDVEALPPQVTLPEETGATFAENAELKAEAVFGQLGGRIAVLADDSGLEVAALGGEPGVRSARYAGPAAGDADNVAKLLEALEGERDRSARFVCHLVLRLPLPDEGGVGTTVRAVGVAEGEISEFPQGSGGFGYDPVFRPRGWQLTLSQVSGQEKDRVSHRAAAVAELLGRLSERGLLAGSEGTAAGGTEDE